MLLYKTYLLEYINKKKWEENPNSDDWNLTFRSNFNNWFTLLCSCVLVIYCGWFQLVVWQYSGKSIFLPPRETKIPLVCLENWPVWEIRGESVCYSVLATVGDDFQFERSRVWKNWYFTEFMILCILGYLQIIIFIIRLIFTISQE